MIQPYRFCACIKFDRSIESCRKIKYEGELFQESTDAIQFLDANSAYQ
jgi:hypothetical protein